MMWCIFMYLRKRTLLSLWFNEPIPSGQWRSPWSRFHTGEPVDTVAPSFHDLRGLWVQVFEYLQRYIGRNFRLTVHLPDVDHPRAHNETCVEIVPVVFVFKPHGPKVQLDTFVESAVKPLRTKTCIYIGGPRQNTNAGFQDQMRVLLKTKCVFLNPYAGSTHTKSSVGQILGPRITFLKNYIVILKVTL